MIKKQREKWARKIRRKVEQGVPRKQAIYEVMLELKSLRVPTSRATIYRWLSEFNISLQ